MTNYGQIQAPWPVTVPGVSSLAANVFIKPRDAMMQKVMCFFFFLSKANANLIRLTDLFLMVLCCDSGWVISGGGHKMR